MTTVDSAASPVLFIEDSDFDFELIQMGVSRIPHQKARVERAPDGGTARELLISRGLRPALIVVDIQLGGEDGVELLSTLRSRQELMSTPMVIFSTCNNERDRLRALERGANDFYVKPLDPQEFMLTVQSMVDRWSTDSSQTLEPLC